MRILVLLLAVGARLAGQDIEDARMQRGDDKRWADPAFDDRAWPRVRDSVFRAEDAATNRVWLRMRVEIPAEPAVVLTYHCSCEFYLNGVRLAGTGDLDQPRPVAAFNPQSFPIPASFAPGPALLAVRQYYPPGVEAVFPMLRRQNIRVIESRRAGSAGEMISLYLTGLQLFRLVCVVLALGAVVAGGAGVQRVSGQPLIVGFLVSYSASYLSMLLFNSLDSYYVFNPTLASPALPLLLLIQFRLSAARIPGAWLTAVLLIWAVLRVPWLLGLWLAEPASWTPWAVRVYLLPYSLLLAISAGLVAFTWRRAGTPRLLLVASTGVMAAGFLGRIMTNPAISVIFDTSAVLLAVALVTGHVVRTSNLRRNEEQRLRGELEAAKTVQALLLSRPMPAGVDAVYLPASEVGGDFYQVLDRSDGSRVVLVGDVSGKGLKAAMLVSVAVGILRNEKSSSPAAILSALNNGLAEHTGGGFVTCCCARIDRDGTVTIANAGHPSPYRDGREVAVAAGLPLGVIEGVAYEESAVPGERFTFVSDGVVEAENPQRELFGFERTREISTQSAREIAEAAKAWGQNDDITVVTVRRRA
jgi:sigma-B regulation protein RsbU (phosphoserine phosphatase)